MSDNIIEYIKRREEERSKLLKEEQQPVEEEVVEVAPVITWEKLIKENKVERLKQESKISIDFKQPFELEKLQEIALIEKINDIIKFRDPVLEKMEYREWLKILQNKMVDELDPGYAKKLYEQDMSRVEKYEELKKKSGKGRNKITVTVEDLFTPADLIIGADEGIWYNSSDLSKIQIDSSDTYNPRAVVQWDSSAGAAVTQTSPSGYSGLVEWPGASTSNGIYGIGEGQIDDFDPSVSGEAFPGGISGGNPFTLAAVLYVDQNSVDSPFSQGHMINIRAGGSMTAGIGLYTNGSEIRVYGNHYQNAWAIGSGMAAYYPITSGGTYTVIFVYEGSGTAGKLYLNGTHVATNPGTSTLAQGKYLVIDAHGYIRDELIGDVFGINRALTSEEIAQLQSYWNTKYSI